jgi:hypothetical protein
MSGRGAPTDQCRRDDIASAVAAHNDANPYRLPSAAAEAAMRGRREKVFGPGRAVPLDRNQKARIAAYARAWDRQHRQPGERRWGRSAEPPWTS